MKAYERISDEDYQPYFDHFSPDLLDPEQWAEDAWAAGMRYLVITTKHHDGFCLWDSKLTDFSAAHTPWGRDVLRPIVDAFRARGMRIGLYHSLLDWHHPDFPVDLYHPGRHDEAYAQRPATNAFTSRISNLGQPYTARNPNYLNTLGFDAGQVTANGVLPNNATSTNVRVTTVGDFIFLGSLTRGVMVSDTLPAGVVLIDQSGDCTATGRTVNCAVGSLAAGETVDLMISGTLDPAATGRLRNTAKVTTTSADPDGAAVPEEWADGFQLLSSQPSQGTFDPVTRTWAVGAVPQGDVATLTLTGRVTHAGDISNEVSLSADTPDPDMSDRSADVTTVVGDVPSPSPSPTDPESPSPSEPGDPSPSEPGDPSPSEPQSPSPTDPKSTPSDGPGLPTPPPGDDDNDLPGTGGPGIWVLVAGLIALGAGAATLVLGRRGSG